MCDIGAMSNGILIIANNIPGINTLIKNPQWDFNW